MIRSLLALVIGFAITVGIFVAAKTFLENNDPAISTKTGGLAILLGVDAVAAFIGGFFAASLAPSSRRLHALVLGILMGGVGVALIYFPLKGMGHEAIWYRWALAIIALIFAALGGRLRSRK